MPAETSTFLIFSILGGVLGGVALGVGVWRARRAVEQARRQAEEILRESRGDAETRAHEALVAAQEKILALTEEADRRERELDTRESELDQRVTQLDQTGRELKRQSQSLDRARQEVETAQTRARELENAAQRQQEEAQQAVERAAGLTAEQARQQLIAEVEDGARRDAARLARKIEDEARESAEREALNLVVQATQRINVKRAVETTVSYIELPSDEMKGRIIGREGRNIRALENTTGIDLIVDDTPRSIVVSSFDPVRRQIAQVSIERLIEDGRIHPARIEEVVDKVREETDTLLEDTGSQAAFELGISDLNPRLNHLVGAVGYRTHHGHNLLQHSIEVALIGGYMAAELGAPVDLVRRAGLLHEIGHAEPSGSGSAASTSAELVLRFGEQREVAETIQGLEGESDVRTPEILVLRIADRISGQRPGARKENLEVFIERLRRLEEIAVGFDGVHRSFAVKAGKELRVVVDTERISDSQAHGLSRRIARAVEKELSFQGKIKVDVVRETRAIQFAL